MVSAEARGYVLGGAVAAAAGSGFILARKPGKLPRATASVQYQLEYGVDALEMHHDAIETGQRVLIVDDVLATGGTARAAARLIRRAGADLHGLSFLIELDFLGGRQKLDGERVFSVLRY